MNPAATASRVVELRQYTLHTNQREALIELFDREFVEPQEAVGMAVIGEFRDLDRPDTFVWLRGFQDMSSRLAGLTHFYGGPVWHAHRDAANATMIDSDDVLLLRPARPDTAIRVNPARPEQEAAAHDHGPIGATIVFADDGALDEIVARFDTMIAPTIGGSILGCYRSELAPNSFPALPVRADERVVAWFVGYSGIAQLDDALMTSDIANILSGLGIREIDQRRLMPTARSLLWGAAAAANPPRTAS